MFTITGMFAVLWMIFAVVGIFDLLKDLEIDIQGGWFTSGARFFIIEEELVEGDLTGLGLTEQEWWDLASTQALEVPGYMASWPDGEEVEVTTDVAHALDLTEVHAALLAFWRNQDAVELELYLGW